MKRRDFIGGLAALVGVGAVAREATTELAPEIEPTRADAGHLNAAQAEMVASAENAGRVLIRGSYDGERFYAMHADGSQVYSADGVTWTKTVKGELVRLDRTIEGFAGESMRSSCWYEAAEDLEAGDLVVLDSDYTVRKARG